MFHKIANLLCDVKAFGIIVFSTSNIGIQYFAMASNFERPEFGFVILSNGEIVRGTNPYSYDENQIAQWYAAWIMMKQTGAFNNKPENELENQLPVVSSAGSEATRELTPEPAPEPPTTQTKKKSKRKGNKKGGN